MVANTKEKPRPQSEPTFRSPEIERITQNESGARMIAKIVRELLASQRFAQPADLRDAVEDRCRELNLACTRAQIERACDLVGSNAQLLTKNQTPRRSAGQPPPALPVIKHQDARAILNDVGVDVSGGRLRPKGRPAKSTSRLVPM